MASAMYRRGGHPRAQKQVGRQPLRKRYQAYLRSLAKQGVSHDAGGNQIRNCRPDGQGSGNHMYYGYKLGK